MSLKDQTTLRIVLYEGAGSQPLATHDRCAALSALLEKGFAVTCANGEGQVAPADRSSLLVLGRFLKPNRPKWKMPPASDNPFSRHYRVRSVRLVERWKPSVPGARGETRRVEAVVSGD